MPIPCASASASSVRAGPRPPHLASLTLTMSAARRRITSTRSRTPNTASSARIGADTRSLTQRQPVEIGARHRLLDQLDVEAGVLDAADDPDGLARRPALVGVEPDQRPRADGGADPPYPLQVAGGVRADLDLEHGEPVRDPVARGGGQRVGVAGRERDVGGHAQRRAAEQPHQRYAEPARGQVVQRDVDRGLGRLVADDGARGLPAAGDEVVRVPAGQQRPEHLADARLRAGDRGAGDLPDLRRLAVSRDSPSVSTSSTTSVLHLGGAAQRGDERRVQRGTDAGGCVPRRSSCAAPYRQAPGGTGGTGWPDVLGAGGGAERP